MKIHFSAASKFKAESKTAKGALVVLLPEGKSLSGNAIELDKLCQGKIKKSIGSSRFEGKNKQVLALLAPEGLNYDLLLVLGTGKTKELDNDSLEQLGGKLTSELNAHGVKQATLLVQEGKTDSLSTDAIAVALATGAKLKSYRFDKYKTKLKDSDKPTLESLTLVLADDSKAKKAFDEQELVIEGVFLTRDLVNEPGNVIEPESYAKLIKQKLGKTGLKIEVLGEKEMAKLGFGALLGVGQGSVKESQIVIMKWEGGKKGEAPIAFVGKGVTFDTGGISIKPSSGMEEMKMDMGGSGAVVGLMHVLAARKAKANVIGVVGLVENMPDGNAQRPGDVVTSYSSQTIEVLNTDAEGRLVLADCLWYTQEKFKPQFMVDLATLTGAILVALGETTGGLFSNDDTLSERLLAASKATGEKLWRLPMGPEFDELINSPIADMQNISSGRWGGSITAAQFLKRFVNDVPWAHLDIAGVATASKATDIAPKGGSGFGVRLLNNMIKENFEK